MQTVNPLAKRNDYKPMDVTVACTSKNRTAHVPVAKVRLSHTVCSPAVSLNSSIPLSLLNCGFQSTPVHHRIVQLITEWISDAVDSVNSLLHL